MHQLDYSREEICFELQGEPDLRSIAAVYTPQSYDNEVATTIYFGATSEGWDGVKILSHLGTGIKVRFYEKRSRGNLFLVANDASCVVELKSIRESHGHNMKVKAGEETPITYGDFLAYIANLSEDALTEHEAFRSVTPTLIAFVRKHRITGLKPVGASSYVRKHFLGESHRISLDTSVRYYVAASHDKDIIFSCASDSNGPILEIKMDQNLSKGELPILRMLDEQNTKYEQTKITKGMKISELAQIPHAFVEPELDEQADNDWVITEREIKLDAQSDPRPTIKAVPLGDNRDVFGGEPIVNINYQRVYDVGPSGIVYMSADLEGADPMLKHKTFMHNDEVGALVRKEVVIPYTPENLQGLAQELNPGVDLERVVVTPYFCRDRMKCNVYMADSRNVFEIYGDHSSFVSGGYHDFNQVEIEYSGIICEQDRGLLSQSELETSVNSDFTTLRKVILDIFVQQQNPLSPSTRSKYDWANTEVFQGEQG